MRMTSFKYHFSVLIVVILFTSCTKVIDLKLESNTGQLVIEANLTNVTGLQTVKLSRNVAFTSTNNYPAVSGAIVKITNDRGITIPFTEGVAGTYSSANLSGSPGTTYSLSVTVDGKTYTSRSTMPRQVNLDSISATNSQFENGKNQKVLTVHFVDPVNDINQYRFILYVNSIQVKSIFAYNDDFSNGRNVSIDLYENDIDIYTGDVVSLEMQCIDKPVYTYWFTLMQQGPNNPGGGVAPSNPPTNITPAVLGYFSAHTSQTITFRVK